MENNHTCVLTRCGTICDDMTYFGNGDKLWGGAGGGGGSKWGNPPPPT